MRKWLKIFPVKSSNLKSSGLKIESKTENKNLENKDLIKKDVMQTSITDNNKVSINNENLLGDLLFYLRSDKFKLYKQNLFLQVLNKYIENRYSFLWGYIWNVI